MEAQLSGWVLGMLLVVAISALLRRVNVNLHDHKVIVVSRIVDNQQVVIAAKSHVQVPREDRGEGTLNQLSHSDAPDALTKLDIKSEYEEGDLLLHPWHATAPRHYYASVSRDTSGLQMKAVDTMLLLGHIECKVHLLCNLCLTGSGL